MVMGTTLRPVYIFMRRNPLWTRWKPSPVYRWAPRYVNCQQQCSAQGNNNQKLYNRRLSYTKGILFELNTGIERERERENISYNIKKKKKNYSHSLHGRDYVENGVVQHRDRVVQLFHFTGEWQKRSSVWVSTTARHVLHIICMWLSTLVGPAGGLLH